MQCRTLGTYLRAWENWDCFVGQMRWPGHQLGRGHPGPAQAPASFPLGGWSGGRKARPGLGYHPRLSTRWGISSIRGLKPGALGEQRTPGRHCLSKALAAQQPANCPPQQPPCPSPTLWDSPSGVEGGGQPSAAGAGPSRPTPCALRELQQGVNAWRSQGGLQPPPSLRRQQSLASSSPGPGPLGHLNSRLPVQG